MLINFPEYSMDSLMPGQRSPQTPIDLVYIVAINTRLIMFEWFCNHIDRDKFRLFFILLSHGEPPFASFLRAQQIPFLLIHHEGRHQIFQAGKTIHNYLRNHPVNIVHTHFISSALAGLVTAAQVGIPVRIQTRHHAGSGFFPLHYRPIWGTLYDWYNNVYSTKIIAPSNVTRNSLLKVDRVKPEKIVRIDHGFDLDIFAAAIRDRTLPYQSTDAPVIGVVARYKELKGVQFIIPAFEKLLRDYPHSKLVIANAWGPDKPKIDELLKRLPSDSYTEIPFEPDQVKLYRQFDIFIHAPISPQSESFGQTYVEALAAGIPSIFTLAGIAQEFIKDRYNAHVVPFENSDAIYHSLTYILENPEHRAQLIQNGLKSVRERFNLNKMIQSLETLYLTSLASVR